MADSLIRWKRGDYVKLAKAVASFNRKVNKLTTDETKYLPELRNYKELKNSIMTRKELNRVVNSLKKFKAEGMEKKIELPSGKELTKWEYNQIKLARNRAIGKLEDERMGISEKPIGRMGDKRLREINRTIERYRGIEYQQGSNFKASLESLYQAGRFDAEMIKFEQYRTNFMNSLEEMSTYDNYEELQYKLSQIKNPKDFYDFVRQSPELMDLFLYYKDKATAQTYGGYVSNQDAFNAGLEKLGIFY
jgi:hypothetical protein